MGPALQYLAGEMSVEAGQVMPLVARHNTVRMQFHVEQAEYLHLAKPDASFPALHLSRLADHKRNQVAHSTLPASACRLHHRRRSLCFRACRLISCCWELHNQLLNGKMHTLLWQAEC